MRGNLKFFGAILGWIFGRLDGALIGFFIGAVIDSIKWTTISGDGPYKGNPSNPYYQFIHQTHDSNQYFHFCLIAVSAAVLQADGTPNNAKLNYIKDFLNKQSRGTPSTNDLHVLRDLTKSSIPIDRICSIISANMNYTGRLQLLHYLFGIGAAGGGTITDNSVRTIEQISFFMSINPVDYLSVKELFKGKASKVYYEMLGISADATNEEIKKAYRRMALKYHPDSVTHLGEVARIEAEEKFKKLLYAYQQITKERNIA
jgi:DnaJ like chaperone protein